LSSEPRNTEQLESWLLRMRAGEEGAREALINYSVERLRRLTHKLLAGFPAVQRWEQTDDVLQQAVLRLYRSLGDVYPENLRAYLGLAALQIRRELTDLARHYYGPEGLGANHATDSVPGLKEPYPDRMARHAAAQDGPATLLSWCEFHQQAAALPEEEREVFDLLFYQGLSQAEAATLLDVSEKTVKRRWRSARLALHASLGQELAE